MDKVDICQSQFASDGRLGAIIPLVTDSMFRGHQCGGAIPQNNSVLIGMGDKEIRD